MLSCTLLDAPQRLSTLTFRMHSDFVEYVCILHFINCILSYSRGGSSGMNRPLRFCVA